jgi:transposase
LRQEARRLFECALADFWRERAALMYTLIHTAKLNAVDPQVWLADVLARIADHPVNRVDELLPWKWKVHAETAALSQAA